MIQISIQKSPKHSGSHKCGLIVDMPTRHPVLAGLTFHQDLGDLCMAGTEGTVELEAVSIIQKGSPQREQHFLDLMRKSAVSSRSSLSGNTSRMQRGAGICLTLPPNQHPSRLSHSLSLLTDGLKLPIRKYSGLSICETDAGFCLLSNYSGDVTGFPGLCLQMTYLGCLNIKEKIYTAFGERQKSEFSWLLFRERRDKPNKKARKCIHPNSRKHISLITNPTLSNATLSSRREQIRT